MTDNTVAGLLEAGSAALATPGMRSAPENPRLEAQVLLAHVLALPRAHLLAHPEGRADATQAAAFRALLARRAAGEPVAYLTGRREFWSLDLRVTPDVLVPRPETELLVERALTLGDPGAARVADLGTGSGAIALALAHERPAWQLIASDVSEAALAVARENARALGLGQVDFRVGDWFAPLAGETFNLIVSNPPYVAAHDPALLTLAHEPRLALTPGDDALQCLRTLARGAAPYLRAGGWLLLEHGADQGDAVRGELVAAGFRHVRSHRDLSAHERLTEGQR